MYVRVQVDVRTVFRIGPQVEAAVGAAAQAGAIHVRVDVDVRAVVGVRPHVETAVVTAGDAERMRSATEPTANVPAAATAASRSVFAQRNMTLLL